MRRYYGEATTTVNLLECGGFLRSQLLVSDENTETIRLPKPKRNGGTGHAIPEPRGVSLGGGAVSTRGFSNPHNTDAAIDSLSLVRNPGKEIHLIRLLPQEDDRIKKVQLLQPLLFAADDIRAAIVRTLQRIGNNRCCCCRRRGKLLFFCITKATTAVGDGKFFTFRANCV